MRKPPIPNLVASPMRSQPRNPNLTPRPKRSPAPIPNPSHRPSRHQNRRSPMPQPALMNLKVLLPFEIFADKTGVSRIVAETREGSFGLLPHRLDCVAALAPGILTYQLGAQAEVYMAVDEGVLVKTGLDVLISVR